MIRPTGRPTAWSPELAEHICGRIAEGETLKEICADENMPASTTVRGWDLMDRQAEDRREPSRYPGFSALYARARLMQVETEVDEIKIIANTPQFGVTRVTRETLAKDGTIVTLYEERREDMLGHRKLQLEARQWRAGKIAWREYGQRAAPKEAPSDDEVADRGTTIKVEGGLPDDGAP